MSQQADPRARYIAIAAHRFARVGFHGASLSLIAGDAGVSKQALLHFFHTKDRLYAEVLNDLSIRLLTEVDAAFDPDPEAHLAGYLTRHTKAVMTRTDDARLAMRAILDSDAAAALPLKPYLDMLLSMARKTRHRRGASDAQILADLYQLVGTINSQSVSARVLSRMYTRQLDGDLGAAISDTINAAVRRFVTGS